MTIDDKPASIAIALGDGNPIYGRRRHHERTDARPCPICGSVDESHVYSDANFDYGRTRRVCIRLAQDTGVHALPYCACPICDTCSMPANARLSH